MGFAIVLSLPHFPLRRDRQVVPTGLAECAIKHIKGMSLRSPEFFKDRFFPKTPVKLSIILQQMGGSDNVFRQRLGADGGNHVFPSRLSEYPVQDFRRVATG